MADAQYPKSIFISAGQLFRIAFSAYERTKDTPARELYPQEPLVAIVFAAASLEAFINEAGELANKKTADAKTKMLALRLRDVEECRGSISKKFSVFYETYTEQACPIGKQPFQDFKLLVDLRNLLVHLKPLVTELKFSSEGERIVEFQKVIRGLPKNLLFKKSLDPVPSNWIQLISTPAMARWACNAAARLIQDALKVVSQEDSFKRNLDNFYGKIFQPIN